MNEKILLVEDEVFIRDLYGMVLKKAGFDLLTAADGEEGVALQNNPDAKLILLDIMMPKFNGIEVFKQLKADPVMKNLRVVFLTNLTDEGVMKEALDLGAESYLVKVSTTPKELADKVTQMVSVSQ